MIVRIAIALFVLSVILSHPVRAEEDMLPQKRELIKELLRVLNTNTMTDKQVETSLANLQSTTLPQVIDAAIKQQYNAEKLATIPEEQKNAIIKKYSERIVDKMRKAIAEKLDVAGITEGIYFTLYGKYFDEKELQAMIDFYRSPVGTKAVSLTPQIYAEAVKLSSEATNKVMIEIYMKTTKDEMAALVAELFPSKCDDKDDD